MTNHEGEHSLIDHTPAELQEMLEERVHSVRVLTEKMERVLSIPNIPLDSANALLDATALLVAQGLQEVGPIVGALVLTLEHQVGIDALEALANGE